MRLLTVPEVGTDAERATFRRLLGETLQAFRKAHGLSQQEVADYLGVEVETVGRWERGTREPKAYELRRLMDRFGADPDWLLSPTDSTIERDRRTAMLREVASAAARADVADELRRRGANGTSARRGRARV